MPDSSFSHLTQDFKRLKGLINQIGLLVQGTNFENAIGAQLELAVQRLIEQKFILAFVGDWNSGKSSLINRLLFNDEVLPTADDPTTSRITTIRYGENPKLWRLPENANSSEQLQELAEGAQEVKQSLAQHATPQDGKPKPKEENKEENYELILDWNSEVLKTGLIIVDTPGLSDPDRLRSLVTEQYMQKVDGIIVVTDPFQLMTAHLADFLAQNVFRRHVKKFFFLMNKIDRLLDNNSESLGERLEFLRESVENIINKEVKSLRHEELPADRYFPVSAKTGKGINDFLEKLKVFADSEKFVAVLEAAAARIYTAIQILQQIIEREEAAIGTESEEWEQELEKLKTEEDHLRRQVKQRIDEFHTTIDDLQKKIEKEFGQLFDKEVQEAEVFYQRENDFISKIFSKDFIKKVNIFVDNQQKHLEIKIEELDDKIRFEFTRLLEDLTDEIEASLQEISGPKMAAKEKERLDLEGKIILNLKAEALILTGSIATGLAGGSLAVAAGWATTTIMGTTQTVASTLPTWVPGWIAAKTTSLGLFTTTVTQSVAQGTAIAWATALSYAVWPASVALLGLNMYLLQRQRKNITEEFSRYIDSLKLLKEKYIAQQKSNLLNSYQTIRNAINKTIDQVMADLKDKIERCQTAAANSKLSPESEKIKACIPDWKSQLNSVRSGSRPS